MMNIEYVINICIVCVYTQIDTHIYCIGFYGFSCRPLAEALTASDVRALECVGLSDCARSTTSSPILIGLGTASPL